VFQKCFSAAPEAHSLPQSPIAWFNGQLCEREGGEREERRGEGKGRKEEEGTRWEGREGQVREEGGCRSAVRVILTRLLTPFLTLLSS